MSVAKLKFTFLKAYITYRTDKVLGMKEVVR